MGFKAKKRKSPGRPRRKEGSWLLPAALVLALLGGLSALLWPNPAPRDQAPAVAAAPVARPETPVELPPAGNETRPFEEDSAPSPAPQKATAPEKIAAPVAPLPVPPGKGRAPRLAIVLDDMGLDHAAARRAAELPGVVTLAFLPYARDLPAQTDYAREKGHELMVHMPMEPASAHVDPGPEALRVGLEPAEIKRRLDENLGRFTGYVGFNNHMGSRFTADTPGMRLVMEEAKARGLLFLDSRTTSTTVGAALATAIGVPYAQRDVFLDNSRDPAAIRRQLGELETLARKHGAAIAIGHPHPETLAVLEYWIPEALAAGYELVPLSALVKDTRTIAAAPAAGNGG